MLKDGVEALLTEIRACTHCKNLPCGPRPVVRFSAEASILVVGQAPGAKVHESGIPWNDQSGTRLRDWMGLDPDTFYDVKRVSIVPMGFCYPGSRKGGDLPPRHECSQLWLERIQAQLRGRRLTLLIGKYSQEHYLAERAGKDLTLTVRNWKEYLPKFFVLPHPSPANNRLHKFGYALTVTT